MAKSVLRYALLFLPFFIPGDLSAQKKAIDSLKKVFASGHDTAEVLPKIISEFTRVNTDSAQVYANVYYAYAVRSGDKSKMAAAIGQQATIDSYLGKQKEAIAGYHNALSMAATSGDSVLLSRLHNSLGYVLANTGDYEGAVANYRFALDYRLRAKDTAGLVTTYVNFGLVYFDQGDYQTALDYEFKALNLAEKTGDEESASRALNNIANAYFKQEKYTDAITYYRRSIGIKQKLGNKRDLSGGYGNIGVVYMEMKSYDSALYYFKKSYEIKQEINDKRGLGVSLHNMGLLYIKLGNYTEAQNYLGRALDMRKSIDDKQGMASTLSNLAILKDSLRDYPKAIEYAEQAVEYAKQMKVLPILAEASGTLADVYSKTGDYKKAFEAEKQLKTANDSIFSIESLKKTAEFRGKYESEHQARENERLQQQIKDDAEKARQRTLVSIGGGIILLLVCGIFIVRYVGNQRSKKQLQLAYNEIEEKNKSITDSIIYAKRIQQSILPETNYFLQLFPGSFIFYRPKDIVSGDFWWIHENESRKIIAVADCTGHGVPGAFMSVMGADLLSQATKEKDVRDPASAMDFMDAGVRQQLRQTGNLYESRDGMEMGLLLIPDGGKKAIYSGAMRSLMRIREGKADEFEASRFSIGGAYSGAKKFENREIDLQTGDMLFLFSDGYSDQFGGPEGKKYKSARLKNFLAANAHLPGEEQQQLLEKEFDTWKGNLEQVDDVCVVGIRV